MRLPIALAFLGILTPAVAPRAFAEETWRVDPAKSELVARTFKAGVASSLAHDHIVRASRFTAELRFDPARVGEAKLSMRIPVDGLVVDEPELRKKYHLEKTVGDADRGKIHDTMLGDGQLDAAQHPLIALESTRVEAVRGRAGSYTLSAKLTLHGTVREISVPLETRLSGKELRARGTFTIKQSEFGIEPYSAALGAIKNKDEVQIIFSITAIAG